MSMLKSSSGLITLIAFAVAGIIGLQVYFFTNSLEVRKARFQSEVMDALAASGKRMETMDAMYFLDSQFDFRPWFSEHLDNLIPSDTQFHYSEEGGGSVRLSAGRDTVINTLDGPLRLRTREELEHINGQTVFRTEIAAGTGRQAEDSDGNPANIQSKVRGLDTLFVTMLRQSSRNVVPIEKRFTLKDIDSVLHAELEKQGIDMPFECALSEGKHIAMHTEGFAAEKAAYRHSILENDIYRGPRYLMVQFPHRWTYLYQSMWVSILLSVIFTTLVVYLFWNTVRQMSTQKRIAQIKGDFINNMTHEFKTPIASIQLATQALKNPKVQGDAQRVEQYLDVILQENRRMHAQVEHVLKMAMLDKGQLELAQEKCKANAVLAEACEHSRLMIEERGGTLDIELHAPEVEIVIDPHHFGNILTNILDNANKYSPDKPVIKASVELRGKQVLFTISDRGMGMSDDEKQHVFERFFRAEKGNVHNVKGHGLGLSYAYEIALLHNGNIEVQSAPGKGSTFVVSIPAAL